MHRKLPRNIDMNSWRAQLVMRSLIFLVIFLSASGLIGSRVVAGGLAHRDGFAIYGRMGETFLFAAVAFSILIQRRLQKIELEVWSKSSAIWLALSFANFAAVWFATEKLAAGFSGIWTAEAHIFLICGVIFAAVGVFGLENLRNFLSILRKELVTALILSAAFYGFLMLVYSQWKLLTLAILFVVSGLLHLSGLAAATEPGNVLIVSKFSVSIAQYCSGIESIALFTALYALVGLIDWTHFDRRKFFGLFFPALLLMFGLNIVRIYSLIMAGYFINQHIAFSLFHTYAGMVLFIGYSAVFWVVAYKWMLKNA
jgi:exosortase/archaeosortase family protein